jgi:hypothetical protein
LVREKKDAKGLVPKTNIRGIRIVKIMLNPTKAKVDEI